MASFPTTPCPFGRPFRPGCWRRVSWLALVMHSLVASGLPLPLGGLNDLAMAVGGEEVATARLAAKDRSQPFPCQDKPCGCNSAKQCYSSCCCHTPKELLAWARANGLEPAVLTALTHRIAAETHEKDSPSPRPSESTSQKASCCVTELAAPPREASCCAADTPYESQFPATASDHRLSATAGEHVAAGSCCASTTAAQPFSAPPPLLPKLHEPAEICEDYDPLAATPPESPSVAAAAHAGAVEPQRPHAMTEHSEAANERNASRLPAAPLCCDTPAIAGSASDYSAAGSPADSLEPLDASEPEPDPEPGSRRTVVLSAMLACGGISSGWLSAGIAIVTPLHAAMTPLELLPAGSLPLVDETSPTVFSAPDLPPPRALAG